MIHHRLHLFGKCIFHNQKENIFTIMAKNLFKLMMVDQMGDDGCE